MHEATSYFFYFFKKDNDKEKEKEKERIMAIEKHVGHCELSQTELLKTRIITCQHLSLSRNISQKVSIFFRWWGYY